MIPYIRVKTLDDDEIEKIHSAMVSILTRTGLAVEHPQIRQAFAEYGAQVDHESKRVRIPEEVINRFLDETEPLGTSATVPTAPSYPRGTDSVGECYRPLCPGGSPGDE